MTARLHYSLRGEGWRSVSALTLKKTQLNEEGKRAVAQNDMLRDEEDKGVGKDEKIGVGTIARNLISCLWIVAQRNPSWHENQWKCV